ncbi:DEAD/DEAH box helicase family protein, partial [Phascolarctobacterium succinatutens]|uniref:DEAD/DEAH box helicase family protein n=1 Tax=Phascolarctobacterium succinatutens TaxID=626940 RepID=UPI0030800CC3
MAMQINITPYANIVPKIYAYTTPEIARHNGWTKIGYTEQPSVKKRIEQQTKTADVRFNIEWQQEARYTDGSGEYFTDHNFHDYLERFEDIKREPNTEWFNIDGPTSQQLLWKFAARSYAHVQAKNKMTYVLRREQQQAVDATYAYYQKCLQTGEKEKAEFLWNAKPRFGKTLTSYDFMRKMDARMVLIVTNRPAIANSWFDDFEKFIAWQTDYRFVSTTDSLKERATLTRDEFLDEQRKVLDKNQELRMVAFLSLQDLKGSVYFGGDIKKLKWIAENNWDLLIIDEAHEGVDTHKTDKAFDKINRKFTLHLSGTPFKAVAMGKFAQEQIFNWTFSDEQEAKDNWHEETLNPYACMPRMNMYTYQMSQIAIDKVNRGIDLSDDDKTEFAFDLNEFFKTNERGQFIHKNEVKKFLDALVEQEKFPFSTPELRKELAHTFWLLERVDSAKALAKMLKEHPVFEKYEIVLAAGDGRLEEDDSTKSKRSFDKVREAIKNHDKTITLSVGQLTTGVTIPEWTAVFMLSNMKSPADYFFGFDFQRNCQYLGCVYLLHFTVLIFGKNGKEVQQTLDVCFTLSLCTVASCCSGIKAVGKFVKDHQGALRCKIKDVGILLLVELAVLFKFKGVLRSEGSLNIFRRAFMSNMLFSNIGVVFNAPKEVVEILNKMEPVEEQGSRKEKLDHEELQEVPVDENGNIEIPQETVVNQTNAIFGEKIYEEVPVKPLEPYKEVGNDTKPEEAMAVGLAQKIAETLHEGIYGEQAQSDYGLTKAESKRIEEKVQKQAEEALKRIAEEFTDKKNVLEADLQHELAKATTEAEKIQVQAEHAE